ncbi:hypothetical protein COV16_04655 [Candidatus Woesearchaeota archaeon CG10_big_fil_rev_8_21_14_0_10_34_8]|nr:MAG: hypothetical protein COV16_04655 [Candidatus Woesearchaeota archaeon CG10_big_fil_rev_8_21_14_0_10_34_8]
MNFQNLQNIEDYTAYLDYAFSNAKKRIQILKNKRIKSKDSDAKLRHSKYLEIERVKEATKHLTSKLDSIHKKFPQLDDLPEFYLKLAKLTIDYDETKKALGAVKWASFQSKNIRNNTVPEIKKAKTNSHLQKVQKQFYGRISSIVRQIKSSFTALEKTRKQMKAWPDIKTEIRTIAIAGYPNVGKSSLLKTLTGTNPEVKAYAFTTKRLNVGYMYVEPKEFQIIDTPGTFDRDVEKMNDIEKQASLVLELLAEKIIYVFDPSESCGYEINKQISLLKRVRNKFNKPIIVVCNKIDIQNDISLIKEKDIIAISATEKKGIDELKKRIWKKTI